jgi:hypothetical protein
MPGKHRADAAACYSDRKKFSNYLKTSKGREMSEYPLKTLRKSGDFQAEYEGSIPFTRSKAFKGLLRPPVSILTAVHFLTGCCVLISARMIRGFFQNGLGVSRSGR